MQQSSILGYSLLGFHRMAYTAWGQSASGQLDAAPPVICVHGLSRNGRDFDNLAGRLSSSRKVYCPDMVGRGQSDWLVNPAFYNYTQYANDITALVAHSGAPQIDWIGTSMGGILGMMLAASAQSPIRRMVINDVGPYLALEELHRIGFYVGNTPDFADYAAAEAYLRQIYAPFGITREEDWQHMARHSLRQGTDGKWRMTYDPTIAQGLKDLTADITFWDVYDRITCPVLLIRGALSTLLTHDVAQEMTQRGPKAQLIEIPDVGHAPALMDEASAKIIADFLG